MDARKTGKLIRDKRQALGMSQKDLAEVLKISDKAVSKWECGKTFPDISMLIPLSESLDVSLYDLLTGGSENE